MTLVHEHMPGCSHFEFMENVVSPINQCSGILTESSTVQRRQVCSESVEVMKTEQNKHIIISYSIVFSSRILS